MIFREIQPLFALIVFYGWYHSGKAFDKERVFSCESQYLQHE